MEIHSIFAMGVIGFLLYLFLKRYPELLGDSTVVIDEVRTTSDNLQKFAYGPRYLMSNVPWLFRPQIGSVMTAPNGTDKDHDRSQPIIFGTPLM